MKRKPLLLVAFLIVLYVAPLIFAPSYSSTIVKESNFIVSSEPWLSGFSSRKSITLSDDGLDVSYGANYHVLFNVSYDAYMQTTFADLRFTDSTKTNEIDYWIENKLNSSWVSVWVEVIGDIDDDEIIYMYYGNSTVSSASDGSATFPFFEDFSAALNGTLWDTVDNAPSISNGEAVFMRPSGIDADQSAILADAALAAGSYKLITKQKWDTNGSYTNRYAVFGFGASWQIEKTSVGCVLRDSSSTDSYLKIQEFDSNDDVDNDDEYPLSTSITYQRFDMKLPSSGTMLVTDGTLTASKTKAYSTILKPLIGIEDHPTNSADNAVNLTVDYIFAAKLATDNSLEPTRVFGDREQVVGTPRWQIIGSITVIFHVLFDYWAFDMILIFLGLAMIILGSLYAAYKIQNEPDRDTIAIVLLLFMFGFGLFLGGIGFLGGG